jgi:hypothetical protein
MPCEFQFDRDCALAFHLDFLTHDLERLPSALIFILIWVCRVQLIHVQVFLIDGETGKPKRGPIVVSQRNPWRFRLVCTDHVQSRRVKVEEVSKTRFCIFEMRSEAKTAWPVADFFAAITQLLLSAGISLAQSFADERQS